MTAPISPVPEILLVEDDEGTRLAFRKMLENAGFLVRATGDYQDALNILAGDTRVDVLITDIVMPHGINGFALGRMGRMRRRDLKIVYVTAYDVPSHEAVGPVLRKPVPPETLIAEIRKAIDG